MNQGQEQMLPSQMHPGHMQPGQMQRPPLNPMMPMQGGPPRMPMPPSGMKEGEMHPYGLHSPAHDPAAAE